MGRNDFAPAVVAFVRYTMSDLLYAMLAVAALLCLDARAAAARSPGTGRAWTEAASSC